MNRFHLTDLAALDIQDVYQYSVENWGVEQADRYLENLYQIFAKIAADPRIGRPMQKRSEPYLMVRAGRHFVVYDRCGDDVVIIIVPHSQRDIESLLAQLGPALAEKVETIRQTLS